MGTVNREQFLAFHVVAFPRYEEVDVPGLGKVWVKQLNAGERDKFEQEHTEAKGADYRARWVVHACITEQGAKVFDDADLASISLFEPQILDPIVRAAVRVNRLTPEDMADFAKNSNGQPASSVVA